MNYKDLLYPSVAEKIHKQPFTNFTLHSHYPGFNKNLPMAPLSPQSKEKQSFLGLMKNLFVASTATATCFAPFIRVKLLLQCQGELIKTGRLVTPYKGFHDCHARIIANEGFLSLWRGNTATILGHFTRKVCKYYISTYDIRRETEMFIALCASSLAIKFALDYSQTRLATDIISMKGGYVRQFKGSLDVWRKTCQSDGMVGNYRGFTAKFVHEAIHWLVYHEAYKFFKPLVFFGSFYAIHQLSKPLVLNGSSQNNFILMGIAMVQADIVAYPFETARRRMMMTSCEVSKYKSTWDCLNSIVRKEGVKSLYGGVGINIMSRVSWTILMIIHPRKDS